MKEPPFSPDENPEAAVSILNSCILLCDVVIAGEDAAAALKYDEENMFAPMIVVLEKDAAADALVRAAGNLGVPVIKNIMLAKNLSSYGKTGTTIPESSYRDVSLTLARLGLSKPGRKRRLQKKRKSIPVKIPRPLSLELGISVFAVTGEEPGREKLLAEPLNAEIKKLRRLLGFAVPPIRIVKNSRLKNDEYRILFKGVEAGRTRLELGWYAKNPDISAAYVPDLMNDPENMRQAVRAIAMTVFYHAKEIIRNRAPELLGRDAVQAILDAAEEKYPVVTGEVKSLFSLGIIREVLMSLVGEQVSIRHIAVILETLADWGSFGPAPSEFIIDQIRQSLKRQICLDYTDDRQTLRVMTIDPKLEKRFGVHFPVPMPGPEADFFTGDGFADVISTAIRGMRRKRFPPVILCSPKVRFPLKEVTRRRIPDLAVLSYMEIPSDINVESMGEIGLDLPSAAAAPGDKPLS